MDAAPPAEPWSRIAARKEAEAKLKLETAGSMGEHGLRSTGMMDILLLEGRLCKNESLFVG